MSIAILFCDLFSYQTSIAWQTNIPFCLSTVCHVSENKIRSHKANQVKFFNHNIILR